MYPVCVLALLQQHHTRIQTRTFLLSPLKIHSLYMVMIQINVHDAYAKERLVFMPIILYSTISTIQTITLMIEYIPDTI